MKKVNFYKKNIYSNGVRKTVVVMAAIVLGLIAFVLGLTFENTNSETAYADEAVEINSASDFIFAFYSTGSADNKTYILKSDICIENSAVSAAAFANKKFSTTLDSIIFEGNYHTITFEDININVLSRGMGSHQAFGLFGSLTNSSIRNLKINGNIAYTYSKSSILNTKVYLGVLAGRTVNTDIDNVWSDVNATFVTGSSGATYAGGLVGAISNASVGANQKSVSNILITGNQTYTVSDVLTNGYIGGLAGKLSGVAKNISQYAQVAVNQEPNGTVKSGGIFAVTTVTQSGENSLLNIEYAIFSNAFNPTSLFAFPQTNSLTEKKTKATLDGQTTTMSTCMSFAMSDPYRFSSDDKNQFITVAKAVTFERQFFAYRLYTHGSKLSVENLPMLCWKTLFDNLPVPTTLTDFFKPVSAYENEAYQITSDEEFNDMSLFQCFSSTYSNQNMTLKTNVKIDNDFLPFQSYVGKTFDGKGYAISVPGEVTVAAIKAGIFAYIEKAKVTDLTFNFYGKFTSAIAVMLYANNIGAEGLLENYDTIVNAINNNATDIPSLTDYESKIHNGTWNHAAFICYAKASEAEPYEVSKIMVDFNGRMETSSKYWSGEDSTTARAGALVGEEWHYVDGVSPKYENCLVYWRGGMILDSALPSECKDSDGIYVRLDVGVFWNGSDQGTVSGLSKVWTIAKNGVLSEISNFKSRGFVVTGCLIKEMMPNTINASISQGITGFYLMQNYGTESIVTKELLSGSILNESKVICNSNDSVMFDPNEYVGETQAVLYAYTVATVNDYRLVDGTSTLYSASRFLLGSVVNRTYNHATDKLDGKCFVGFDNSSRIHMEFTVNKLTDVVWYYLPINQNVASAVYTGNEVDKSVSDTYGKTVAYGITYSATIEGAYTEIASINIAGYYKVTATYSDDSSRLGEKTYGITVNKAPLKVTPAVGQKSEKSKITAIADIYIEYACARTDLLTGSLTLKDFVTPEVKDDYEIVIGTLLPTDENNYYIDLVIGVTYEICNSFVTIKVADKAVLTKVYDGTNSVNVPYTVVEGENKENLCVLNIGNNTEVGAHQVLVADVAVGYVVKLITAYYEITPKTVNVTVTGGTEKYYDKTTDCDISFSANGLVSSDLSKPMDEIFSGKLSYIGGYDVDSNGYTIALGSLSSKNYHIVLDNGGYSYIINRKQILISVNAGQSRMYNSLIPDDIEYTYSLLDGNPISLPYGDVFDGALTLDCQTERCDVLYDEFGEIMEYSVLLGTLSLGNNYELVLDNNGAGVKITPRAVADIAFPDVREVVYTPNSNVRDIIKVTLGAEVLTEDRAGLQPLFKLYRYNSSNNWEEMDAGAKPGIGTFMGITTGEFTNKNYRMLKIDGKYVEYSVEFTITPYELTKANFDFDDVITEFSGTTVLVGVGTTERETGNDYPGVVLFSSRFEDQNNNSSDGMQEGVPYLAGVYRQICVFKCNENYSCTAIASTTSVDFIEIKRNIIIEKKALNVSITYNNSESRTTPYLAKSISIDVKAYGNTLQESVTLNRSITLDGLTADSIFYVGKYTIKYSFNPSDGYYIRNYRLSDGISSDESEYIDEYVVTKATPTVRSIVASDITYETSVGYSVITATVLTPQETVLKDGMFSFTKPNIVPDAGYYEAEVVYIPGNTYEDSNKNVRYKDNYNSFFTKVVVNVIPQTVVVTPKQGSTQEYNEGRLNSIEYTTGTIADKSLYGIHGALSAVALDGTAVSKYVANTSYKVTIGTLKFVKFDSEGNAVDTDNYILSLENGTHTVTPKKIQISFSDFDELRYNYSPDANTLPCRITQNASSNVVVSSEFYLLDNFSVWTKIDNPFDKYGVCKMLNAGYYKVLSFIGESADNANYTVDDASAVFFFNVERMILPLTCVEYESTAFDYNGNVRELKVKEDKLPPNLVINYKNNANVYAGTYTVSVFVTSTSKNYTLGGVALSTTDKYEYKPTLTINKYKVTEITVEGIDELVYNGSELNIVAEFVGVRTEDNVKKTYVITRNNVVTSPIYAGDYTMTVDIQENDNYELDESCDNVVDFTIKKHKLGLQSLQTIIKVYNGNTSVTVTPAMFELKGIIGDDEVTVSDGLTANFITETTGINKEIVVTDITLGGADKDNYYVDTGLIKITGNIEAKRYDNSADSGLDLAVVPIKDSNIPLKATLKAILHSNDDYKSLKKVLLNNNEEIYKVFTYELYDESDEVLVLTNAIKLSLNTEGSQIKIYTLNNDELSEVEYTMNGTYAEFTANTYEKYVVTVERKPNNVLAPLFKSPFFYVGLVLLAGGIAAIIVVTVKKRKGVVK